MCLSAGLLVDWRAGEVHAKFAEDGGVNFRYDNRRMNFASLQSGKLIDGLFGIAVGSSTDGEGNQHLVHMKMGIVGPQMGNLQILDENGDFKVLTSLREYLTYRGLSMDIYNPKASKKKGTK